MRSSLIGLNPEEAYGSKFILRHIEAEENIEQDRLGMFQAQPEVAPPPKIKIEFNSQAHIQIIYNKYPYINHLQIFPDGYLPTYNELRIELTALAEISNDEEFWINLEENERLSFEKYRLSIIKATYDYLQIKNKLPADEDKNPPKEPSVFIWFVFGSFMALELVPMLWGGFLGTVELLTTIPWLAPVAINVASLALCAVEAFLFYAVMSPLLKMSLGIFSQKISTPLMEVYGKQHQLIKNIDNIMAVDNDMNTAEYKKISRLNNLFDEHIIAVKQTKIIKFEESFFKKGVRLVLSVLTTVLNVAGGYFFGLSLLGGGTATAALIGTPIGWGIIGLVILGQIALRLAVRSNAMIYTLNPGAERHIEITEEIDKFQSNAQKRKETLVTKCQADIIRAEHYQQQLKDEIKKNPYVDDYYKSGDVKHRFFNRIAENKIAAAAEEEKEEKYVQPGAEFKYSEEQSLLRRTK